MSKRTCGCTSVTVAGMGLITHAPDCGANDVGSTTVASDRLDEIRERLTGDWSVGEIKSMCERSEVVGLADDAAYLLAKVDRLGASLLAAETARDWNGAELDTLREKYRILIEWNKIEVERLTANRNAPLTDLRSTAIDRISDSTNTHPELIAVHLEPLFERLDNLYATLAVKDDHVNELNDKVDRLTRELATMTAERDVSGRQVLELATDLTITTTRLDNSAQYNAALKADADDWYSRLQALRAAHTWTVATAETMPPVGSGPWLVKFPGGELHKLWAGGMSDRWYDGNAHWFDKIDGTEFAAMPADAPGDGE